MKYGNTNLPKSGDRVPLSSRREKLTTSRFRVIKG